MPSEHERVLKQGVLLERVSPAPPPKSVTVINPVDRFTIRRRVELADRYGELEVGSVFANPFCQRLERLGVLTPDIRLYVRAFPDRFEINALSARQQLYQVNVILDPPLDRAADHFRMVPIIPPAADVE